MSTLRKALLLALFWTAKYCPALAQPTLSVELICREAAAATTDAELDSLRRTHGGNAEAVRCITAREEQLIRERPHPSAISASPNVPKPSGAELVAYSYTVWPRGTIPSGERVMARTSLGVLSCEQYRQQRLCDLDGAR